MSAGRLADYFYRWTLKFKDPTLEGSFQELRKKEFARNGPRLLVLLIAAIGTGNALIRLVNNLNSNRTLLFAAGLAAIIIGLGSIFIEFITHIVFCLRYIRGLFLCTGATLTGMIYGAYLHETPVLQPGSLLSFVLAIFGNIYFAHDWRFATFNQIIAHMVTTIFLVNRYYDNMSDSEVFIPLLNINALLLILPFFFYFAERDKRQIAFHPWPLSHLHLRIVYQRSTCNIIACSTIHVCMTGLVVSLLLQGLWSVVGYMAAVSTSSLRIIQQGSVSYQRIRIVGFSQKRMSYMLEARLVVKCQCNCHAYISYAR